MNYVNSSLSRDISSLEVGNTDIDLLLNQYISVIEIVNPMHRMWSDGRWNKLTMAPGCYGGKCHFAIFLDYIKYYDDCRGPMCDRMEEMILQTVRADFILLTKPRTALMANLALKF